MRHLFFIFFILCHSQGLSACAGGGGHAVASEAEDTSRKAIKVVQKIHDDLLGHLRDCLDYLEILAGLHASGMSASLNAFDEALIEKLAERPDFLFEQKRNLEVTFKYYSYFQDALATHGGGSLHEPLKLVLQRRIEHLWQRDKRRLDGTHIVTTDPARAHELSQYDLSVSQSSQVYYDSLLDAALALLPACDPEKFDKQTILLLELDFGLQNLLKQTSVEDIAANSGHPDDAFSKLSGGIQFVTVAAQAQRKLLSGPWRRTYAPPRLVTLDSLSLLTRGGTEAADGSFDAIDFDLLDTSAYVRALRHELEVKTCKPHYSELRSALQSLPARGTFFADKRLQNRFLGLLRQRLQEQHEAILFSEVATRFELDSSDSASEDTLEKAGETGAAEVSEEDVVTSAIATSIIPADAIVEVAETASEEAMASREPASSMAHGSASTAPSDTLLPRVSSLLSPRLQSSLSELLEPKTRSFRYDDFVTLWEHFAGEGSVRITKGSHGTLFWEGLRVGNIVRPHPVPVLGPYALKNIRQVLRAIEERIR